MSAEMHHARLRRSGSRVLLLALAAGWALPTSADDVPGARLPRMGVTLSCEDEAGRSELPACDERCTQKVAQWRFWVTQYNVENTWGWGEHQGIGVFGFEYTYDERFGPAEGKVPPPWSVQTEHAARRRLSRPDENGAASSVLTAALCESPKLLNESQIYNHGRTLALFESGALSDSAGIQIDMPRGGTFYRGPAPSSEWLGPASAVHRLVEKTRQCIAKIEDGFCDSVCGNCSYVLPEQGQGDLISDIRGQVTQFTIAEGHVSTEVSYVRTTKEAGLPSVAGTPGFSDSFTHCAVSGDGTPAQTLSTRKGWTTPEGTIWTGRVITGRWGHNSNTDASAEFEAFGHCGSDHPEDEEFFYLSCHSCGTRQGRWNRGGETQWPCLDRTNEATSKWYLTDGMHNVDDASLGKNPDKAPRCGARTKPAGQLVRGM